MSTPATTSARARASARPHARLATIPCRYHAAGYCARGASCWFLHGSPPAAAAEPCTICYETPSTYGLMTDCAHVFCLSCIRAWRSSDPAAHAKTCPLCRARTRYVIPSLVWPRDQAEKKKVEDAYLRRLGGIKCRYFEESKEGAGRETGGQHGREKRPQCPFGNQCFYKHVLEGETYVFDEKELKRIRMRGRAGRKGPLEEEEEEVDEERWLEWAAEWAAESEMGGDYRYYDDYEEDEDEDEDEEDEEDEEEDEGDWEGEGEILIEEQLGW